ncbi:MAG: PilT/PilU family type 4a pilus ATPase [Gemmatimonadetes bacterium]|nr:PilT/PilU family type 4a pilus ATPase [Gemmatimonadota bacterium]MBT6144382.1 PilT/PilU family type 4a pilus ATPase [Gemmatimonadota bacterium]MBT7859393.1 PilT/PilU family type 4a pilus ATPase [Gemmatimonadota bacterium]
MESSRPILAGLLDAQVKGLTGIDRQRAIAERLERRSPQDRQRLVQVVEAAMVRMAHNDASDLDLGAEGCGGQVWYRIHGRKCPDPELGRLELLETDALCLSLLSPSQLDYLFEHRNLDFSYQIEADSQRHRYRADLYFDLDHLALNCRYIADSIRPFKELGLHPNVVRTMSLVSDRQGLVLVTGLTGSGKSSTLDSIVDANNKTAEAHIVIIASPVETIHRPQRCIIRHREVGRDVHSFREGAIQALRQDPDAIVIGEMRDPETIITALELTDTGHKVLSTLHTASAVESIDRIIGECPAHEQDRVRQRLADTLQCVVSQKLIPTLDGQRVLATEVLLATTSIRAAIRNNNTVEIYQMLTEGSQLGMQTMEQNLLGLVTDGRISEPEARIWANNKPRMNQLLGVA